MRYHRRASTALVVLSTLAGLHRLAAEDASPPEVERVAIYDSEKSDEPFLNPADALASIRLPDGFRADVFAAEPDVRQPIAMAFDERGRLWVAENYTYARRGVGFDRRLRDRLLILNDTDGDGVADERKVFWEEGDILTSVEIGFGGVWVLSSGALLFLPDADRDDRPDGEPLVHLDGWDQRRVRHNVVNGLRWGPDGWLYGRHGILATSLVGPPGTPREERTAINCGLWRYHPVTHDFEVVAHGTTNSWGHDWTETGELIFINTVIGHLWHAIPGSHFERMYGEDLNPHVYELIPQIADHYHWSATEKWHELRKLGVTRETSKAGGGHAHSGLLIYQGGRWPDAYRGEVFTANFHGRRVNQDHLERRGSTYVARHRPDFLTVGDVWFRGLDLITGPGGNVYLNDWSDVGECHENDGVHRTSGRIYKISYGDPDPFGPFDLHRARDERLAELQRHENSWWARQARRILQERAAGGNDLTAAHKPLRDLFQNEADTRLRLRALWTLHVTGAAGTSWLTERLTDADESVRAQAVRLLVDQKALGETTVARFAEVARVEPSGLVLAHMAAALRHVAPHARWSLADAIASRAGYDDDPALQRLLWYGIEEAVLAHVDEAIALASRSRFATVRRLIARRITEEIRRRPSDVASLFAALATLPPPSQRDILSGADAALQGWRRAKTPSTWSRVAPTLLKSPSSEVRAHARSLSVIFGDGRALEALAGIVADGDAPGPARRSALESLVRGRAQGVRKIIEENLRDRTLGPTAIRGLEALSDPQTPRLLLDNWADFRHHHRATAVDVLSSRAAFANQLLGAVAEGRVARSEVPVYQVRRMRYFKDASIESQLDAIWPELRVPQEKKALVERYTRSLAPSQLADADLGAGRQLFVKTCAPCHKLLGEGGEAGPELTGANRSNLAYLVLNLVDPNAEVADSYRASMIALRNGSVLSGVIGRVTPETLALRTPTEERVIARETILAIERTSTSIMPEGLLETLTEVEQRDLIAYLMQAR